MQVLVLPSKFDGFSVVEDNNVKKLSNHTVIIPRLSSTICEKGFNNRAAKFVAGVPITCTEQIT
jgi:hypothetical protein